MEFLSIKNLSFSYSGADNNAVPSIDGVSFSVNSGELVTLFGSTGSGKSTLLRLLKPGLSPLGRVSGEILYNGSPISEMSEYDSARRIGYVAQRPEEQIVTDRVWHELAFGLENLGVPQETIRLRVAETASYFGIEKWFERRTSDLSGGEAQLLNIASAIIVKPEVLILDEPTAQLDPIASTRLIDTIVRLNRELSLTVIIAEHCTEDIVPMSDKLLVLDHGKLIEYGTPEKVADSLPEHMICAMPAAVRLYHALGKPEKTAMCPLTVRDGRNMLYLLSGEGGNAVHSQKITDYSAAADNPVPTLHKKEKRREAISFENVCFRYTRESPDVLHNLTFTIYENEICCILGGNGAGKSTAMQAAVGLLKPYRGMIKIFEKKLQSYSAGELLGKRAVVLPQDVETLFMYNTVREELKNTDISSLPFGTRLETLMDRHPYDLSGGEAKLVAISKVLAGNPKLVILDEPTTGLDAFAKQSLIEILQELHKKGITIVVVSHDLEFAAELTGTAGTDGRCAMFFRGEIISFADRRDFFLSNSFYTTPVCRMTQGISDGAVTVAEAAELFGDIQRDAQAEGGKL